MRLAAVRLLASVPQLYVLASLTVASLYQESARAGRGSKQPLATHVLFFTLNDVIDLLEWSHGDYAKSVAGQQYARGLCMDLIDYLVEPADCRHALLERALGDGEAGEPCCFPAGNADHSGSKVGTRGVCDNCARRRRRGASSRQQPITLLARDWGPALLRAVHTCRREAGGDRAASLRAVARCWLRARDGPSPTWTRVPLLLLSLRHNALHVSFEQATHAQSETPIEQETPSKLYWRAMVVGNHQLLLGSKGSSALASISLTPEQWDPSCQGEFFGDAAEAAAQDLDECAAQKSKVSVPLLSKEMVFEEAEQAEAPASPSAE